MEKKKEDIKPNFLGDLVTGLAESFLGLKRPEKKTEQKPVEKRIVKRPVRVSRTYITINYPQPKRKGILKWLVGLFW